VLIPAIVLTAPDASTAMRNLRSFAQEMCMAPGTIPKGDTLGPNLSFPSQIPHPFPRGTAADREVALCTSRRGDPPWPHRHVVCDQPRLANRGCTMPPQSRRLLRLAGEDGRHHPVAPEPGSSSHHPEPRCRAPADRRLSPSAGAELRALLNDPDKALARFFVAGSP